MVRFFTCIKKDFSLIINKTTVKKNLNIIFIGGTNLLSRGKVEKEIF
jgi:hypothetical protein